MERYEWLQREQTVLRWLFGSSLAVTAMVAIATGNALLSLRRDQEAASYYSHTNPPASFVAEEQAIITSDYELLVEDGSILATCIVLDGITACALVRRRQVTDDAERGGF